MPLLQATRNPFEHSRRGKRAACHAMFFASLFNDRAIAYRDHQGYDHHKVALSAGVQRMVRSKPPQTVMFTLTPNRALTKWSLLPPPMALVKLWCKVRSTPMSLCAIKQSARKSPRDFTPHQALRPSRWSMAAMPQWGAQWKHSVDRELRQVFSHHRCRSGKPC